jgi:NAD(P)-dependent dehydrogenase (short-subunit alcohol dehydrogenase family)
MMQGRQDQRFSAPSISFPNRYRCTNRNRMRLSYVFVAVLAVSVALIRVMFVRISHKELDWDGIVIPMARAAFGRGEGDDGASSDRPPLEGVKVVITGATNGIGLSLARVLTQRLGATVVAVGRSEAKLQKLKGELGDSVTTVEADLVDLASVSRAADTISETFDSIDILINNAGIFYPARSTLTLDTTRFATEQGYDRLFVTNYLSHVLLTEKLLPKLQRSSRPTVVQVTSNFHWGVDGSDLVPPNDGGPIVAARPGGSHGLLIFRGQRAYANSKLGQLYHARSLKRRYSNIRVVSVCPSWVGTNIVGPDGDPSHDVIMKLGYRVDGWGISSALYGLFANETGDDFYTNTGVFKYISALFARMPAWTYTVGWRDAITSTFAFASLVGQHFFSEISPTRSSPESYDMQKAEALWDWSYKALKPYL